MLILQGCNALSKFRVNKLLSTVQAYIPEIISLQTCFIHFVNENEPLNENEQAQLEVLLNSRIDGHQKYTINSTPTIVINEKKLEGSVSFKNIKKKIEKLI